MLRNVGGGGCGSHPGPRPPPRWRDLDTPSRFQPTPAFDRAPASRRRTRLANSDVRGAASAPGPPQPRPVTLAASARATSNAPPLRVNGCAPRNQGPQQFQRPQIATFGRSHDAVVAPASLSPNRLARLLQPLECALPLRSGQRQSQLKRLLRAVGRLGFSYASSAARGPATL